MIDMIDGTTTTRRDCVQPDVIAPWPPGRPPSRRRLAMLALSLVWLAFPLADLFFSDPPSGHVALGLAGTIAFIALFLLPGRRSLGEVSERAQIAVLAGQAAIAAVLTLADRPSWAILFIFTAAGAGLRLRAPLAQAGIGLCSLLAVGLSFAAGAYARRSRWGRPRSASAS